QHDDVTGLDAGKMELAIGGAVEDCDPLPLQPAVHVRIVNDFAHQEDARGGELLSCFVRVLHRAIDTVTESEIPGEAEGQLAGRAAVIVATDVTDQPAVI